MKSLSCIIPVYGLNIGDNIVYFDALIHSLSEASLVMGNSFELVIVNDDKDGTPKQRIVDVCSKYGLDNKVVYLENDCNKGQAYSRNAGVLSSTGDYLHFMDQDDYISRYFYDEFVKLAGDVDIFISKPFFCICNKIKPAFTKSLLLAYKKANYLDQLWFLLISNVAYSPGQVILSRKSYDSTGGFPVLKNRGADDFGLYYNLIFNTNKFPMHYLENSEFYYRIHSRQNSKLSSTNKSVYEFLNKKKIKNLRQKVISLLKTNSWMGLVNKLFYVFFFKRAIE